MFKIEKKNVCETGVYLELVDEKNNLQYEILVNTENLSVKAKDLVSAQWVYLIDKTTSKIIQKIVS